MRRKAGSGFARGATSAWCVGWLFAALLGTGVSSAQVVEDKGGLVLEGKAPSLFLLYTGDVIGYLETCGCKRNPAGGLARRAWVIGEIKRLFPSTPILLLDSGNFSDNPTPEGDIKTRALLEGMRRLGYAAVNVGERDVRMGYDHLAQRAEGVDLPLVSANIVLQDGAKPVFPPSLVVEAVSADGQQKIKVGVVGVARYNPIFLKAGPGNTSMVLSEPAAAVRAEVARLRGEGVKTVVLLAALHKDDARRLVQEVPGIDFIVGSYGGAVTGIAEKEADTWIMYSGNQGKRLGETRVFLDRDGKVQEQVTLMHFLTEDYPSNPEMEEYVNRVRTEGRISLHAPAENESPYVGSVACRECHESAYEQWSATPHARALDRLTGEQRGTDCIGCHVTGAGAPGGFLDASSTPQLAQVGCESCHGPGREHVERPIEDYGKVEIATCTGCHDLKNSPHFDYYAFLPRVTHEGQAASQSPRPAAPSRR